MIGNNYLYFNFFVAKLFEKYIFEHGKRTKLSLVLKNMLFKLCS